MIHHSYRNWKYLGYFVKPGERHVARCKCGLPLFSEEQVEKDDKPVIDYCGPGNHSQEEIIHVRIRRPPSVVSPVNRRLARVACFDPDHDYDHHMSDGDIPF